MRILHVNMTLDPKTGGGTAERVFQLSRYLTFAGHNNTILTTSLGISNERIQALKPAKIEVLPIIWKRFYLPLPQFFKIFSSVKNNDLVHIVGHWTIINCWVYLISKFLKKPYVVTPAGALAVYGRSKFLKKIYNSIIGRKIISEANDHIAITSIELPSFANYNVSEKKIKIVPNAVERSTIDDIEKINRTHEDNQNNVRPYILFIGRLNEIKGPDLLLKAFSGLANKFQEIDLVLAGPDEGMKSILEKMTNEYGLQNRVKLIGYIGGVQKQSLIKQSILFVVPSRQEAMSIVALEAAAQSTPVLITDQCGFDEIELHGGKVVKATSEGIEEGIRFLISEEDKLEARGIQLRNFVESRYSWEFIANQHLDIFNNVVKSI